MTPFRPPQSPLLPPGTVEVLRRDMTVIAGADVTLAAVQERLAEAGQWLPLDGDPHAPLGRLVEENSTGPLRLGYGAWRDLLLGVQFRNGKGELITAGGRTVKNVAGYDLTKFMVGQRGIFGSVVTLTSRTYRRPAAALVAEFSPAVAHLHRLLPTSVRPHWAVLRNDALWCGFLGEADAIAYYESKLVEFAPRRVERRPVEEDVTHREDLWRVSKQTGRWFRAAVPPAKVQEFVSRAKVVDWTADAAFGVVLGAGAALDDAHDEHERVHAAAQAVGGTVYFVEPGGHVVRWGNAAEEELLQRLKAAFDPEGQLEPL